MDKAQQGLAFWAFLCLLVLLSFCYRDVWCNLVLSQTYFGNGALGMTNLSAAEMAFSFVDGNYGYYLNRAALPGQETDGADGVGKAGKADGTSVADGTGQTGWMDGAGNATGTVDGSDMTDGTKTVGGENMTDGQEATDGTGQAGRMDGTDSTGGTDVADGTNKTGKSGRTYQDAKDYFRTQFLEDEGNEYADAVNASKNGTTEAFSEPGKASGGQTEADGAGVGNNSGDGTDDMSLEDLMLMENQRASGGNEAFIKQQEPVTTPDYQAMKDFDYLVKHYYTIDSSTSITAEKLNAEKFLSFDAMLQQDASKPQILVYHTHSQEAFADSVAGDTSTTIIGVGEELCRVLREEYGLNVLHDTGTYDLPNRDYAYSVSAPAIEKILAENPSIEVIIDLHRDGVSEGTRLVKEIGGRQTAQFMFFNGISYLNSTGAIAYLENPYIEQNLAFSFQMKLAADRYYPGFCRNIYLKGLRYNMHYRPKSLLIEVGAQTNTVEEVMNAVEPLAQILAEVLKNGG